MSTMVQMTVQNVTPQTRRFFVLGGMESSGRLDIADPYAVAFGAWQSFLLAPGDHGYTALSSKCQVAARSLAVVDPEQPIVLEANIGEFPAMSPPSHLTAQYRQDNGVTAWRFT